LKSAARPWVPPASARASSTTAGAATKWIADPRLGEWRLGEQKPPQVTDAVPVSNNPAENDT
jgi:hypothetical protein